MTKNQLKKRGGLENEICEIENFFTSFFTGGKK
jgi:hypothetical protein